MLATIPYFRFIALCLCLAASGCVRPSVKQGELPSANARTVWRASTDNGDKPGNGITLVDSAGQISATFFLLDPNKPHDFKAGRPLPTQVVRVNESELRFLVDLGNNQKDEFVIRLDGPLKGNHVKATFRDVGEGSPIDLTFVRRPFD